MRETSPSLPDTVEADHFGAVCFRVGKRIFASCGEKDGVCRLVFQREPEHTRRLVASDPRFEPCTAEPLRVYGCRLCGGLGGGAGARPRELPSERAGQSTNWGNKCHAAHEAAKTQVTHSRLDTAEVQAESTRLIKTIRRDEPRAFFSGRTHSGRGTSARHPGRKR